MKSFFHLKRNREPDHSPDTGLSADATPGLIASPGEVDRVAAPLTDLSARALDRAGVTLSEAGRESGVEQNGNRPKPTSSEPFEVPTEELVTRVMSDRRHIKTRDRIRSGGKRYLKPHPPSGAPARSRAA